MSNLLVYPIYLLFPKKVKTVNGAEEGAITVAKALCPFCGCENMLSDDNPHSCGHYRGFTPDQEFMQFSPSWDHRWERKAK
jgi:hypothetical protein